MRARFLKGSTRIREMQTHLVTRAVVRACAAARAAASSPPGLDPLHVYLTIASLSVFYLSNQYTLSVIFGRELGAPDQLAAWEEARRSTWRCRCCAVAGELGIDKPRRSCT